MSVNQTFNETILNVSEVVVESDLFIVQSKMISDPIVNTIATCEIPRSQFLYFCGYNHYFYLFVVFMMFVINLWCAYDVKRGRMNAYDVINVNIGAWFLLAISLF